LLVAPFRDAVSVMRSLSASVAAGGEMLRLAPSTMVMLACCAFVGSACGVTVTVTVSGCGTVTGAV